MAQTVRTFMQSLIGVVKTPTTVAKAPMTISPVMTILLLRSVGTDKNRLVAADRLPLYDVHLLQLLPVVSLS